MIIFLLACGNTEVVLRPEDQTLATDDMVAFAETEYRMGYPDVEPGPYGNHWKETAQPQHPVSVSAFELDRREVTVAEYASFLNTLHQQHPQAALPHHHPLQPLDFTNGFFVPQDGEEHRPVRYVSWYNAATFCAQYNKRLPTEAEWELAAKGGDADNPRSFPWSRENLENGGASCLRAVYFTHRTLCEERPAEVGSRSPNGDTPDGLQDMAGNVSEWVSDWFGYYEEDFLEDPQGPAEGQYKIVRGGGFRETSDALRTTDRVAADPLSRSEGIGFRCARDVQ